MQLELCVDAREFWPRLRDDMRRARSRVWIQTLSFEGDAAGHGLAHELLRRSDLDRRMIVDRFNRCFQSDRFVYAPHNLVAPAVRAEVRATAAMIASLHAAGVRFRFTGPLGFLWRRLAARDHRKLILVDDAVAYIGGINFSDHNFAWHDLMLRIEDAAVAKYLAADFTATWAGTPRPARARFGPLELFSLVGSGNEVAIEPLLDRIRGAASSVLVHSPYLNFPFCDALATAARRGVAVRVLTPAANNRPFLRRFIHAQALRSGFDLRFLDGGMSHLKALLIDDETLVLGSSNFDFLTERHQCELIAVVRDPALIRDFHDRIVAPDLARATPAPPMPRWKRDFATAFVHAAAAAAAIGCGVPVRRRRPATPPAAEPVAVAAGGARGGAPER